MKIVILIPTIKPGGAEKQAALLARTLSFDYEVHFVALYQGLESSVIIQTLLEGSRVNLHFLSNKGIKKWIEFYELLKRYDIKVAFNYLTFCDVMGAFVEKLAGIKTVFNGIRNSRLAPAKTLVEWVAHNIVADYTIYNCRSGAEYFERLGFCKKKTIVIHNCFQNISKPIKHEQKNIKSIITVGRFEPQKDYLTAIKSVAQLRKSRTDFEFIIVGHGSLEKQIVEWVNEYGLSSYTRIYIDPDNVQELLRRADIYLSTSLYEGTSNSIMEAMNWSVPVVATNVGDNSVLVEHDISGFLVNVGDVNALAQYMKKLLSSYQTRCTMGEAANVNLHNFSEERFRENYLEILRTRT